MGGIASTTVSQDWDVVAASVKRTLEGLGSEAMGGEDSVGMDPGLPRRRVRGGASCGVLEGPCVVLVAVGDAGTWWSAERVLLAYWAPILRTLNLLPAYERYNW